MTTYYHFKGEARVKKQRQQMSRADKAWFRNWWQTKVDSMRQKIADGNEQLASVLAEDLAFARRYGVC